MKEVRSYAGNEILALGDYLQLIKATHFQCIPFLQIIKFGSDINNPAFSLIHQRLFLASFRNGVLQGHPLVYCKIYSAIL